MVFDKVKEILSDHLEIDVADIKMESSLTDDLKVNSVDLIEVIIQLETEYGVEFPYDNIDSISTVADAVKYIEKNQ